ncbi:DedA family protein [Alisedimentitalea sp. MJ-SS2]|uniref:DedA family protein n=1 Tax=Aliisedimentitalea sp. MJ-SS2 TaxID=3049795 RepID=UPI002907150E|nr:DedA family protein [Alisedimentitalea sp. MJ-SS2]MDU8926478.1 DedA family protein [Alisedimentitalea sp. MJ-SS2]
MTSWALNLLGQYGAPLLGLITLASCLALPVPASLVMLTAGGFAASGDLDLPLVSAAALAGAIFGDQIGFFLGRGGQSALYRLIDRYPRRAAILTRARDLLQRGGGIGVFLSRWLFSPLGPYVNFAAGAAGLNWLRFTVWGAAGELVWVSLYVGLGYGFSHNIAAVAQFAGDISGLLAGLALMLVTGLWLRHVVREHHRKETANL